MATAQQYAGAREVGRGRGERGRGGERQGAGASGYKDRQGDPERLLRLVEMPECPDQSRNDQQHQDEVTGEGVGQLGDGRFVAERLILQPHYLGDTRLGDGLIDPHQQRGVGVDGASIDGVATPLAQW